MDSGATIAVEKLNVKIIVMRNTVLGMVHELQDKFYGSRYEVTEIHDVPDFVKLAQSYGIDAVCASSNEEALKYSREMLKSDKPFVLVCNVNPKTTSV